MLRIGLTGGLGSGKSTVAQLFATCGAHILSADAIGRELMQPGQPVYAAILDRFGAEPGAPRLTHPDGQLDRAALARYVFAAGRLRELNQIVHPAVIAEQQRRIDAIAASEPNALVIVESALIFEADQEGSAPGWRDRFDRIILVTAPEPERIRRFLARAGEGRTLTAEETQALEQDARRRIAAQIADEAKRPHCDFVIDNSGAAADLRQQVESICSALHAEASKKD
jgi:dephospho-CoA kinase